MKEIQAQEEKKKKEEAQEKQVNGKWKKKI